MATAVGQTAPPPGPALVSLRQAGKTFPARRRGGTAVQALCPTNLDIAEGEFLTIVGPSGCGKSTLLGLISGLQAASEGEVRVGNDLITGPYTNLGIVFQRDLLLPWRTALDNVLLQAELRNIARASVVGRAMELLELVGLKDFAAFYPHELSGGMRQRVAICRALLHQPPLLLMDEPFAALDAISRDQISLDFQRFWEGDKRTVVFITHNIAEAVFLGDRVMIMTGRPGRVFDILDIELPRPRTMAMRDTPQFTAYTRYATDIFMQQGILKAAS